MSAGRESPGPNVYSRIIEHIFFSRYTEGARSLDFEHDDFPRAAEALGIELPRNWVDILYTFRYRAPLPEAVRTRAPEGQEWIIAPAGRARYRFVARKPLNFIHNESLAETKVPDATPGVIALYALSDEQALLARLRYNRLIDLFTGVTCYSLQSHLRTHVPGIGQVETDEVYVGLDRRGAHYVFPLQAKGGADRQSVVQIEQDFAMCASKFPNLIARPIAAQFMSDDLIALFEFEPSESGAVIAGERHYRLVPPDALTPEDLRTYRQRPPGEG